MLDNLDVLANRYKSFLLQDTNLEQIKHLSAGEMRFKIMNLIQQFIQEDRLILSRADRDKLIGQILDDSIGFGPLEPFLQDETVTEVMANGPNEIFVEREGKLELTEAVFRDEAHLRHIIDRIVAPVGRRIDELSPMVDARLKDGSRVHAVIPPISLRGPVLTIRKFRKMPITIDDLIEREAIGPEMAVFLSEAVKAKVNILVSGGTGSGKTTLLNVLSSFIPFGERLITIEDSAELRLQGQHVVSLETRSVNVEGKGEITIRELVRNALRMRPDRIIVGEVRGGEALDMLQAMNTGHEGSLTTIHANSPYDALGRLESMVLMSGLPLPTHVIREYIVSAIDLIIQTERLVDGKRRVVSIAKLIKKQKEFTVHELFKWHKTGIDEGGQVLGYFEKS